MNSDMLKKPENDGQGVNLNKEQPYTTDSQYNNDQPYMGNPQSGNGQPYMGDPQFGNGQPYMGDPQFGNGQPYMGGPQFYNNQPNDTVMPMISMICGIASVIAGIISCFCCLGYLTIPLSVCAIVTAVMSKSSNGGIMISTAKVGFICGIVGIVLFVVCFIIGFIIGFTMKSLGLI